MRKEIDIRKCPFCGKKMEIGHIYAPESRAAYWLPENSEGIEGFFLTDKSVKDGGGIVLGKTRKIGFLVKERPKSYCCKWCKILITLYAE